MHSIHHFIDQFKDPNQLALLLGHGGYAILFAIIFAETALLVGFFLPGDTLLFLSGLIAADAHYAHAGITIGPLLAVLMAAAILGDATGYFIGRKIGPALFSRSDGRFFRREHLDRAHAFYEKHGGKAIVLARFIFIVRTFVPTVAGAANMDARKFMTYNLVGGVLWVGAMTLLGYFFGHIPLLRNHLESVTLVIVVLSLVPVLVHLAQEKRANGAKRAF